MYILFDRHPVVLRLLLVLFGACTIGTMVGMYFTAVQVEYNNLCLIASGTNAMLSVWCVRSVREATVSQVH